MLTHRTLSALHVVAATLWVVGLGLVVVGLLTYHAIGQLGILVAGVGAVLNIKGFIQEQTDREANAFTLGRDSVHH